MNSEERTAVALELLRQARGELAAGDLLYDPVEVRRLHVRTAKKLRSAADFLDEHGLLTEGYDE